MYAKIHNNEVVKYPYTRDDLVMDNPNVSFPVYLEDVDLTAFNVVRVFPSNPPIVDWTKNYHETNPVFNGIQWEQAWEVTLLSNEEMATYINSQVMDVIAQRNAALGDSDWTQVPDAPLSEEVKLQWAEYRQALRDITSQTGFPLTVEWPEKPVTSTAVDYSAKFLVKKVPVNPPPVQEPDA